ncbi:MAG: MopE-related protein [Sandaracinaceae bacterium]
MSHRIQVIACFGVLFALLGAPAPASAFEPFALQVPCRATATNSVGTVRPCITCHDNPDGGNGCATPPCLNAFGMAFNMNGRRWDAMLAGLDSDGDGYTNGEELGDPTGTWRPGMADPATCDCATRPGFASFTPGDADTDGDTYCCVGMDMNADGDCLDAGEHDMSFDCDETDATVSSGAPELCTNAIDNDCDGAATLLDPDCAMVVDRDGDGYCPMGEDMNGDRDCTDPGENTSAVDCDDDEVTVSPAAREFCVDGLDNDCDGEIDTADSECTSDVDADGDGYCPIGFDANMNGHCNDPGEASMGFDCDDSAADVFPMAAETICTDFRDNDCDGLVDFRDTVDCGGLFDADGDGYCPDGRDGNGDGSCVDPGEDAEPGDCDDTNASINPGAMEVCTNGDVDDDCDGAASLMDADCAGYIDTDGDSFCFVGPDMDRDGFCTSPGEDTGDGDCDETSTAINPAAVENCTDGIDNDCDGSTDAADRGECDEYRDIDGDGWCIVGEDLNGDGDCSDAREQGPTGEAPPVRDAEGRIIDPGTEADPTRYPGAPENCVDGKDNDLDGMIDESTFCTRELDEDGDGWCRLGQDLNGDGDCLDEGENIAASDCNDGDPEIHPDAMERCRDWVDADCDGAFMTVDADCHFLIDEDGDRVCGMGVDDNGDGDCLDDGEDRFGVDCDETMTSVNSRAREICDDDIDNNCDGEIDYDDASCRCEMDAQCDDGDPCTTDTCGGGACTYAPSCVDGGVSDGGVTAPTGDDCNCAAVGARRDSPSVWLLGVLALGLVLRRRRR